MKNVLYNMYMKLNYLVFTTQFQAQIVTVKFKIHISIVLGSNISRSGIFLLLLQLQSSVLQGAVVCYFKKTNLYHCVQGTTDLPITLINCPIIGIGRFIGSAKHRNHNIGSVSDRYRIGRF